MDEKDISPGIMVGKDKIKVDLETVNRLDQYGFNLEYARKCIEANKHNHVTATYYLLLKKKLKNGGKPILTTFSP